MRFNIGLSIDPPAEINSRCVSVLAKKIDSYCQSLELGHGVNELGILLSIVNYPPEVRHLVRHLPPKFTKHKRLKNPHTNQYFELNNYVNYSIEITGDEYQTFVNATEEEAKKMLSRIILNSFSGLHSVAGKSGDFDLEKFKVEMQNYFSKEGMV